MARFVGIDVGGTKCHGVAVDDSGHVVDEVRHPTPPASELVPLLAEMFTALGGLDSLGVGVPGLVTAEGVVRASPNLRGAFDVPVGPDLRSVLGIPVHVENDATMAAYGEWKVGAARGSTNAVMVTLGTGIGGGIVMGGRLQRGANGFAGEIGHMVIVPGGERCPCGRNGCWERYASGTALKTLSGGLSGEEIFVLHRDGDRSARDVLDQFADWVALGLANLTNLCDPEVIVIGGGVVDSMADVMEDLRGKFVSALYSSKWRPHPMLVAAELGSRAGAIGGALIAVED